ncbi:FimD/PapC C-terminal domain-containing protein [Shewanella oncorhynchi]|uniref:FimD/PapC C-terminal domain-containing protein n=1 Tax=Shewanella oncorhynchi TaxID=2726434 RepID=A0AA50KA85_9GAMM|nr:FimD/PapC C-terminal domain-containing protein [Shewanella oncorhynchi]WMB71225.1 FimD/PapC C-terminal domain-containing protein [Shewanella oncorhynchi]
MAKFNTHVGYQVLVTLSHNDAVLPFGAMVTVEGNTADQSNVGIVGDAGQVYLSGLSEKDQVTVKFDFTSSTATSGNRPLRQLTVRCEAG